MDTGGNLVDVERKQSDNSGDGKLLIVDSCKTVDAREPQAEEFVGPSIGLKNMKSEDLKHRVRRRILDYTA